MKKLISFKYEKSDGSTSERVLLQTSGPSDKVAGYDLSELDIPDAVEFAAKEAALYEEYVYALKNLMAEYDVKHSYRQFFANKMSNVENL
jgi:hypothetical protein